MCLRVVRLAAAALCTPWLLEGAVRAVPASGQVQLAGQPCSQQSFALQARYAVLSRRTVGHTPAGTESVYGRDWLYDDGMLNVRTVFPG
jgi:hypothetical protein